MNLLQLSMMAFVWAILIVTAQVAKFPVANVATAGGILMLLLSTYDNMLRLLENTIKYIAISGVAFETIREIPKTDEIRADAAIVIYAWILVIALYSL